MHGSDVRRRALHRAPECGVQRRERGVAGGTRDLERVESHLVEPLGQRTQCDVTAAAYLCDDLRRASTDRVVVRRRPVKEHLAVRRRERANGTAHREQERTHARILSMRVTRIPSAPIALSALSVR